MEKLLKPPKKAVIYQDAKIYVCLASYPITRGHTIVVWKNRVKDLHLLSRKDYEYLMDVVDAARNALLKFLKIQKVYLIYADEVNQVHWHLIPRYNEKGFNLFRHHPTKTTQFSMANNLRGELLSQLRRKF